LGFFADQSVSACGDREEAPLDSSDFAGAFVFVVLIGAIGLCGKDRILGVFVGLRY